MKTGILILLLSLLTTSSVWAKEITPDSLIGRYRAEARVAFTRYILNLRIVDRNDFEIQRVYANGSKDETCNGTYSLGPSFFVMNNQIMAGKSFRGTFTCPSDRSKDADFTIHFGDKKIEDLIKGTNVIVTSSAARGMRLKAYVKKQ